MAKSMTPAKRHAIRAKYEAQDQARKNERLGLKPKFANKNKKKKWEFTSRDKLFWKE